MTDAALFYESAAPSLGHDFLDDLQHAIDTVRERPELGAPVAHGFRRILVRRFPIASFTPSKPGTLLWLPSPTNAGAPSSGRGEFDC